MPQTIPLALAVAEKAFREFQNQWLSGLQPSLSLETAPDGQIHVLFKVIAGAGDATGQHEAALHRGGVDEQARCLAAKASQRLRRRSPSYRRRLLKRAAARAAAADADTVTAVKLVQTEAENLLSNTPPDHDPALPYILAVEAEQQPQHYPQDEVCSDETYEESLLCLATLPQLDGHNDSHVLYRSEIDVSEFVDILKNQENVRRRDTENARKEREAERDEDLRNIRRMLELPHR